MNPVLSGTAVIQGTLQGILLIPPGSSNTSQGNHPCDFPLPSCPATDTLTPPKVAVFSWRPCPWQWPASWEGYRWWKQPIRKIRQGDPSPGVNAWILRSTAPAISKRIGQNHPVQLSSRIRAGINPITLRQTDLKVEKNQRSDVCRVVWLPTKILQILAWKKNAF